MPAGRILVYPLPLVHAGGHLDQLAQALHPALRLLRRAGDEVQVAPAAVEDDGEAALGGELLGQALQHLRLVPFPHRLHVADGDWGRGRGALSTGTGTALLHVPIRSKPSFRTSRVPSHVHSEPY